MALTTAVPGPVRPKGETPGRLVRISSGEQVARYVRRLIFDGELRPGMRVPQDDVARALGVSRIPVREALIALEREGWVTIELHRGAFVNVLDRTVVLDHFELLGLAFGFAVRRSLQVDPVGAVERLGAIHDQMKVTDDVAEFSRLSATFHTALNEVAGSKRNAVVFKALSTIVPGPFFVAVPDAVPVIRDGLGQILTAMRRQDGDAASVRYVLTMRKVAEFVVTLFSSRDLLRELP